MRVALVLLAVAGCAKQAAERPASSAVEPKAESSKAAAMAPQPPPPPPVTTAEAPPPGGGPVTGGAPPADTKPNLNQQAATDQARSGGMLGPTDNGSAFEPLDKSSGKGGPANTAHMRMPEPTVEVETVSSPELRRAFKTYMGAIKVCYRDAVKTTPTAAGRLRVRVDDDGKAAIDGTTFNLEVGRCVGGVLAKAKLPKQSGQLVLAFRST